MQDFSFSSGSDAPIKKNLSTIKEEHSKDENQLISLAEFNSTLIAYKEQIYRAVKSMP